MIQAIPEILMRIAQEVQPLVGQGRIASYIPQLAGVPPAQFGMAVVTLQGEVFTVGDALQPFSIQSISKLFALTLAYQLLEEDIWQRVGREPSGNPFNSLVQLEYESGKPRNPFINAGALVITDILSSRFVQAEIALMQFIRRLAGAIHIDYDPAVARSEIETAARNRAMAYLIKSFGNLDSPVETVIEAYCCQCALRMNCVELARAVGYLPNHGALPATGEHILSKSAAKRLSALMLTCGTYDAAGEFAYRVGMPAKSGVGGGIVAHIPGELGICVWSPGLDATGNSLAGWKALELFTTYTGRSVF